MAVYTGEVNVVASLSGKEDSKLLYINNYCKCPNTLTVTVDPSSIDIGTQAKITAYLENGGVPISGIIYMVVSNGLGTLQWSSRQTTTVTIADEKAEAINVISGVTQCVANSVIDEVVGVYKYTEDETTKVITHTSGNLYGSFLNRTIDLNIFVATGTDLVITYKRAGSVENYFTGVTVGEAQIVVSTPVNTEEGLSQIVTVGVESAEDSVPDPGGEGETGTYYVTGPSICRWRSGYDTMYGPWNLSRVGDSNPIGTSMGVSGGGYLQIRNTFYLMIGSTSFGQTIQITVYGNIQGQGQVSATMDVVLVYQ